MVCCHRWMPRRASLVGDALLAAKRRASANAPWACAPSPTSMPGLETAPAVTPPSLLSRLGKPGGPLRLQLLGHQEGQLQGLLTVQAWIAMGVITVPEFTLGQGARAAKTLGHVLARHLEMHAARMDALRLGDLNETAHLRENAVEGPGLVAVRRLERIAMHGVDRPHHLAAF